MTRHARFELVHADAGWFARFRAANGRKVWQTEIYTRRRRAVEAIELICGTGVRDNGHGLEVVVPFGVEPDFGLIEVRDVDERGAA